MTRSAGHKRSASLPLLLVIALFLGALAPGRAANEQRFLTNLALLDELATEAVEQILDSLDVAEGDSISVLADGQNEGNGFVADAFVRGLAHRGCSVRLLMAASPAPAPTPPTTPGQGAKADSGAAGNKSDNKGQGGQPGQAEDGGTGQDGGNDGAGLSDSGLFGGDTTSVSDSSRTGLGWPGDSSAVGGNKTEKDTGGTAPKDTTAQIAPAAPQTVPSGRVYPPGRILEFQVLEFGVTYPAAKKRFLLFGTASVRRLAGIYLQAKQIEGSEGAILQVASGQSHRQDELLGRSRVLAEGATYPFVKPTVPPGQVAKLAEPMVVVGVVASLVYLFYQNQN